MAVRKPIWTIYVFGKLVNGNIKYFTPSNGYLVYKDARGVTKRVKYPTEAQMNEAGYYRVVNVAEEGTDEIVDNILYHYTGDPEQIDEPLEEGGESAGE